MSNIPWDIIPQSVVWYGFPSEALQGIYTHDVHLNPPFLAQVKPTLRSLSDRDAQDMENTHLLCPFAKERVIPWTSPCVSCKSPWYILSRIAAAVVEVAWIVSILWLMFELAKRSMGHCSGFLYQLYQVSVVWVCCSAYPWWATASPEMTLFTKLILLPGTWMSVTCLTNSWTSGRLLGHLITIIEPLCTAALVYGALLLICRYIVVNPTKIRELEELNKKQAATVAKLEELLAEASSQDMDEVLTEPALRQYIKDNFIDPAEACQQLVDYERQHRQLNTLYPQQLAFGWLPMDHPKLQDCLPMAYIIWLTYVPKTCLTLAQALMCSPQAEEPASIFSRECGTDTSSKGWRIGLQLTAGFIGVMFLVSIPLYLFGRWYTDNQREGCFQRLNAVIRFGYRLDASRFVLVLSHLTRAIYVMIPLGLGYSVVNVRIATAGEAVLLVFSMWINMYSSETYSILRWSHHIVSLMSLCLLVAFDDIYTSQHSSRWFSALWYLQLFFVLIAMAGAIVFEIGRVASYRWYRWRSKLIRSDMAGGDYASMHEQLYHKAFKLFYWLVTHETRLSHNARELSLEITHFGSINRVFSSLEIGLFPLVKEKDGCTYNIHHLGILARYACEHTRFVRESHSTALSKVTLKELLKGLEDEKQEERTMESEERKAFDEWFHKTPVENEPPANDSSHFSWLFERKVEEDSDKAWLNELCGKRDFIRFAQHVFRPDTFSHIEIHDSEFKAAMERFRMIRSDDIRILQAAIEQYHHREAMEDAKLSDLEERYRDLVEQLMHQQNAHIPFMEFEQRFREGIEQKKLVKEYEAAYQNLVDTQVSALEAICQEKELLARTGAADPNQLFKELACLQTVKSDIARTRQPVDIFGICDRPSYHRSESDEHDTSSDGLVEPTQALLTSSDDSKLPSGETSSNANESHPNISDTKGMYEYLEKFSGRPSLLRLGQASESNDLVQSAMIREVAKHDVAVPVTKETVQEDNTSEKSSTPPDQFSVWDS